jgi:neurotransmitter:Na+ symporter, NSS family
LKSPKREHWGSRLGIVLAVAGNAIGLGNFLRFPSLAAEYGGGSFLIPYFIALFLLGIPLMWVEWTMGRHGGIFGHFSTPGMFGRLTRSRWGTIVGSLGVSLPLLFAIYYTYIESWTFAYATFTATGQVFSEDREATRSELPPEVIGLTRSQLLELLGAKPGSSTIPSDGKIAVADWPSSASLKSFETLDVNHDKNLDEAELTPLLKPLKNLHTARFLSEYQGIADVENRKHFTSLWPAISFWLITVGLNVWVLSRGINSGIEILAKIAMPLLFIFAIILVISVFSYGTPDPDIPTRNVWAGLDYVWKPNFKSLLNPEVWLVAAGQIFFTLSIGTGSIQAYSCYLNKDQDCAMTGLATVSTNELAEVVLGGSIAIPIAVASFGLVATQAIAAGGSFNLGFVAMPVIFEQMPFGQILGTMWFSLLFFAGITSSVGLCQPMIAFMQEAFGWSRRASGLLCGAALLVFGFPIILLLGHGYLDEYDNWVGTVGLILFGLIETIIFAWVFGYSKMREEMTRGQQLRIPEVFYPVIRYVVPIFLTTMLVAWIVQKFDDVILLGDAKPEDRFWMLLARGTILAVILGIALLTAMSRPLRKASERS